MDLSLFAVSAARWSGSAVDGVLAERAPSGHSLRLMQVSRLQAEDVSLVATIDRSEHVDVQYCVRDGELQVASEAPEKLPAVAG